MKKVENFEVELIEKIKETEDIITFRYRRIDNKKLDFFPGQFVSLTVPSMPDEFRKTRAYSICSSPFFDYIDLSIKIKESGFTKVLSEESIGTKHRMIGPLGEFIFDENKYDKVVFVAGGIGITPFMSMLRYIRDKNLSTDVYLFFSNRTVSSIPFKNELDQITNKMKNIKIIYIITRENVEGYELGRVSENTILKYVKNPQDYVYFSCGPLELIQHTENILEKLNVPKTQFKKEKW
ncbi:MAG: FAD-dependent oxidoreductase [Candidatus Micrarchaeota archaeon]|nr:FAD-dependent oxidoreductase [Candidatus Micrarchaeota archaeon]